MSNYRRLYEPGGLYFFTVNLRQRRARTLVENIDTLRAAYKQTQTDWPFETIAICILPDHLHCLWQLPAGDADFSTRWRLIKTRFSAGTAKGADPAKPRRTGERGIWQRRFWEHLVRADEAREDYVSYIHMNPVRHGLVDDLDDWPYSSWHRYKQTLGLNGADPS